MVFWNRFFISSVLIFHHSFDFRGKSNLEWVTHIIFCVIIFSMKKKIIFIHKLPCRFMNENYGMAFVVSFPLISNRRLKVFFEKIIDLELVSGGIMMCVKKSFMNELAIMCCTYTYISSFFVWMNIVNSKWEINI